jgi:hypothetical protein
MIKSAWLAIAGASVLCLAPVWLTNAQTPAQEPSYPLYCRGPLNTLRTEGGKMIRTPFKWAKDAALKERIAKLEWMDPSTKAQAQKKLATIMVKIGYPDKWRDYSTLKIDRPFRYVRVRSRGVLCVECARRPITKRANDQHRIGLRRTAH